MTDNLAPVYLDNKPINVTEAKPKVSAILSASGKPETTDVKWLQFQPNTQGKALRNEEVLDRTADPSRPIYLTSTTKGATGPAPGMTPMTNVPVQDQDFKAQLGTKAASPAPFNAPRGARPTGGKDAPMDAGKGAKDANARIGDTSEETPAKDAGDDAGQDDAKSLDA